MQQPEADFPPDVIQKGGFDVALRGMVNRPFLLSQKYQAQQMRADRMGMHPDLREFEKAFQSRLVKLGVPMFTHECVRSAARQAQLYADGYSKAEPGSSAHQYGCAIDLIHSIHAWALPVKAWDLVGHVGHETAKAKGIEVTWGGNDGPGDDFGWDPAHWQLTHWRDLRKGFPAWLAHNGA